MVARSQRTRGAASPEQVRDLSAETGVTLGLATILIGDDPASAIYVGAKRRACVDAGDRIASIIRFPLMSAGMRFCC